jgi:hypothetical protein
MYDREVESVVSAVTVGGAYRATKYVSPKLIVRATRRYGKHRKPNLGTVNRSCELDIVLTIGRPNYAERQFIKACRKAKEPFPVRKVQVRMPTARKR